MDIGKFQYDVAAADSGIWKSLGIGDIEVCLRSPLSEIYLSVEDKCFAEMREKHGADLSPRHRIEAKAKSIIDGALIDWRNISLDGEMVPFSSEMAMEIFGAGAFQGLREALITEFLGTDAYLKHNREDVKKTLRPVLSGN